MPAITVHPIASSSLSIAEDPLSVLVSFCDNDVFLCGFTVQTSARASVAVLDSHSKHFARLAAFALAPPLSVSLTVSDLVLNLPENIEQ